MAIKNALADIRTMKALFTAAENEATALGDEQPGAEHLFLAALTLDDASARSALATLGVTTDQTLRDRPSACHSGRRYRRRRWHRRHARPAWFPSPADGPLPEHRFCAGPVPAGPSADPPRTSPSR